MLSYNLVGEVRKIKIFIEKGLMNNIRERKL